MKLKNCFQELVQQFLAASWLKKDKYGLDFLKP